MSAIKANQAEAFLKSPDLKASAILIYGTDQGLVSERAQGLAQRLAKREMPEGEILRLDDSDLESDPDRLGIELGTIPMFGGPKIIRVTAGRRINSITLKSLVEGGPLSGRLIVEAGNLKPDDGLRTLFEKNPSCLAVPCYIDEVRDIDSIIRETLAAAKHTISREARELLVSRLGADRVMTRGELDKLMLYAGGKTEIGLDDVEAIVGDASDITIDRILAATASGDAKRAASEFARALAAGESAQGVIGAMERHFQRLHRIRAMLDGGKSFDDAVRTLRPPLHFKLKDAVGQQCRIWSTPHLTSALVRISAAAKQGRLAGVLEDAVAEQLILDLAHSARFRTSLPARRY